MSNISKTVDLNSDMGEGFGAYRLGDDAAILKIVSSANVACGFHAGDPEIMATTFRQAKENGVAVGAHPGFPDLWGFGRRNIPFSAGEIERIVAYQVGAAMALSTYAGHPISYVKAHGALGNLTQTSEDVARAVSNAVRAVDPSLACLAIALGHQERIARDMGLQVFSEVFSDRAYTDEGHLVDRKLPGAVIHAPDVAAARVVQMVKTQTIETITGKRLPVDVHSICLHSDTPSAVAIADAIRARLLEENISIEAFLPFPARREPISR